MMLFKAQILKLNNKRYAQQIFKKDYCHQEIYKKIANNQQKRYNKYKFNKNVKKKWLIA